MVDRTPTYLDGPGPVFTAIAQLGDGDRLAGIVNESDLVEDSIIYKNASGTVTHLGLGSNTFVGNIGSGVAAVTAAQLVGLLFTEFGASTAGTLLTYDSNTGRWVTLAPGTPGQILSVGTSGLEYIAPPSGGGSSTLAGLTDTSFSNLAASQFLKYDGATWVNSAIETIDLSWIDLTGGITNGEGLVWSTDRFVPGAVGGSATNLSDITIDTNLVMGSRNVTFGTGSIDFTSTLDIGSASWSLTEAAGAFTISTVSGSLARFSIASDGDITLPSYTDSRHDASTVAPENFLYTDGSGNLLSADIDGGNFATWAAIGLYDLIDVLGSQSTTTGHVLTWNGSQWSAQAPTTEGQALTFIGGNLTLAVGRGYVIPANSTSTLTLPSNSSSGDQIKLIVADGDWLNSGVSVNPGAGDTIFNGQSQPFLAYSSTLYLTYDEPNNNWIGSV